MRVREIYNFLNELSPFSLQCEWDNSGLLIGNLNDLVKTIYLSLDIDSQFIENVKNDSLIITHHPLIFKGLKSLNFSLYPANLIQKMVQKNISLISMHTNFDQTHLNRYVASDILGYDILSVDKFICYFKANSSLEEICMNLKQRLDLKQIRVTVSKTYINDCAITTGSGGDLIG